MKIKIAVVFGGKSTEHEVSVISALQTIHALNKENYKPIPIYISKEGSWYSGNNLLELENYRDLKKLLAQSQKLLLSLNAKENLFFKYPSEIITLRQKLTDVSMALPIMHGTYGEDGTIQGIFEMMNIPYTGSSVLSSALCMDKIIMKTIFKSMSLPVVRYIWFFSKEWIKNPNAVLQKIQEELKYPIVVKPADLGSSIGIMKAENTNELKEAIDNATLFSRRIIIEKAIVDLREINCSVLGDYEKATVSVCEEPIINSGELLGFKEKYLSEEDFKGMASAKRRIPALISREETKKIQKIAIRTFQELDCSGIARIDFLIDKNSDTIYINEINAIPGSLSFYLWEASGKSFSRLIDEIITLAKKKHREKNNLIFSFQSNIFNTTANKISGKF